MAIKMDGHTIDTLVFNASNGSTVTKTLTEEGGVTVDSLDIYNKTKLDEWAETINLKNDTTFDSVTPTSSVQVIKSASPVTGHDIELDLTTYAYMVIAEAYSKHVYNSAKTANYIDEQARTDLFFIGRNVQNSKNNISYSLAASYDKNGLRTINTNNAAYGVYSISPTVDFSSNTSTSPTLQLKSPTINVRTGTFALLADLQDINSANMNITIKYSIYQLPKTTLYQTISDKMVTALED